MADPIRFGRSEREYTRRAQDIADRRSYGLANLEARMDRANLDKQGWNREALNRIYFGDRANRNTQSSLNRLMDWDQSGKTKFSTGELHHARNALNHLHSMQRNRDKIDPMYLPIDDEAGDVYPSIAYAAMDNPAYTGQGEGTYVRPSELYADPDYMTNNPRLGVDPKMSRGNPFLKDLSYTTAGPSVTDDDFFMNIPGTGGQGMRWTGDRLDELDPTVRFEDQGYELVNPNPTRYDWENWDQTTDLPAEKAIGTYGFGPGQKVIDRKFYDRTTPPTGSPVAGFTGRHGEMGMSRDALMDHLNRIIGSHRTPHMLGLGDHPGRYTGSFNRGGIASLPYAR